MIKVHMKNMNYHCTINITTRVDGLDKSTLREHTLLYKGVVMVVW